MQAGACMRRSGDRAKAAHSGRRGGTDRGAMAGGTRKKDARCTQRARIPVKEVLHKLRPQGAEISRDGQRIDFDIDMTGHAFVESSRVEP